jgi:hypothetical protein
MPAMPPYLILWDASIARGDKCFTGDKSKRIQRDCNETYHAAVHRSAVWRICPASVVISVGLMA